MGEERTEERKKGERKEEMRMGREEYSIRYNNSNMYDIIIV